jgi:NADH-quinone oxidoreductase subunit E
VSVRRLAKEQPASFAFSPASEETVAFWLGKYPAEKRQSAVLPLLWIAQKQEGWVSEPAIRVIAERLGMPLIRVLEVATFYTMFHLGPVGRHVIQVCGTTPCVLRGAGELMAVCREKIGPKDKISADGLFTWQEVECMGACVNAPMAAVDDYYVEDMTAAHMEQVLATLAAGGQVKFGPQNGRRFSEPEGGALTLLDESLYDGRLAQPVTLPNRPEPQAAPQPEPAR